VYEFASRFVDPITLGLTLLVVALLRVRLHRKRPLLVLALVTLFLVTACHPFTAWLLVRGLEQPYPPATLSRGRGEPIVLVGGGLRRGPDGAVRLADDSQSRALYALEIYRLGGRALIIATGGQPPARPEMPAVAAVMRDVLVSMGVPASGIVTETASRSTHENAVLTGPLLRARSVRRLVLVTEALHMPRTAAAFRAQGFDVLAAPTGHLTSEEFRISEAWWPSSGAAGGTSRALHEWAGLGWYRLRGYLD
jgi:uncharacterized SAM-binding protein YcdF (DUF218 family)